MCYIFSTPLTRTHTHTHTLRSLLALEIISLYTIVQSFTDKQTSRGFSASARKVFLIFSVCEFATQILADTMRSFGYDFKWLMVCQIYFVIWGVLLSTGFTFYGYQLYTKASTLVKAKSGESQVRRSEERSDELRIRYLRS